MRGSVNPIIFTFQQKQKAPSNMFLVFFSVFFNEINTILRVCEQELLWGENPKIRALLLNLYFQDHFGTARMGFWSSGHQEIAILALMV